MSEEFKIDKEFQSLMRSLTKVEYKDLEQSILNEGCKDAITVWKGRILDGNNRFNICQKHNIKYPVIDKTKELKNREAARLWIIYNQFARRNLTNYDRATLALRLEPYIKKRAEQKKRESGKKYGKGHPKKVSKKSEKPINTLKEVATIAGLSTDTIYRVKLINEYAPEKTLKKLKAGNTSISRAAVKAFYEKCFRERDQENEESKKEEKKRQQERDRILKKEGKMEVLDKRGGYGNWKYQEIHRIDEKGDVTKDYKCTDSEFKNLYKQLDGDVIDFMSNAVRDLYTANILLKHAVKEKGNEAVLNSFHITWRKGVFLYFPQLLEIYEKLGATIKKIQESVDSKDDAARLKVRKKLICNQDGQKIVRHFLEEAIGTYWNRIRFTCEDSEIDSHIKGSFLSDALGK